MTNKYKKRPNALFTRFFCKIKHNEKLSKSLFNKDLRQFSLLRIRMIFCRAIRGSAVATLDAAKLLTNAGAPLLSLARLLAMGFNLLDCPFIVAGTGTYKIGT